MNSLPIVTWPQLVYRATPFVNKCCCLRRCLIASIFWKLPSHICMIDSEKPLAPPPRTVHDAFQILIGRLQTLRARYQFSIALYWSVHKIVISCAVGFACLLLWIVPVGIECSMLWIVLLELRVPCCGLWCLDLRVPCCGLCYWI